jgi:hypothetical protein
MAFLLYAHAGATVLESNSIEGQDSHTLAVEVEVAQPAKERSQLDAQNPAVK